MSFDVTTNTTIHGLLNVEERAAFHKADGDWIVYDPAHMIWVMEPNVSFSFGKVYRKVLNAKEALKVMNHYALIEAAKELADFLQAEFNGERPMHNSSTESALEHFYAVLKTTGE
jgi:hypothetical protein